MPCAPRSAFISNPASLHRSRCASAWSRHRTVLRCSAAPPSDADHRKSNSPVSRRAFLVHAFSLSAILSAIPSFSTLPAIAEDTLSAASPPSSSPAPQPSAPAIQSSPSTPPRWSYTAPSGPADWASLSSDYATAANGRAQSPIALSYRSATRATPTTSRPSLTFVPNSKLTLRLVENPAAANPSFTLVPFIPPPPPLIGDAPPVDVPPPPPPPAVLKIDSNTYVFRSAHFHAPTSEHIIEGVPGNMEIHFLFDRVARPRLAPPPVSSSSTSDSDPSSNQSQQDQRSASQQSQQQQTDDLVPPQTVVIAILGKNSGDTLPSVSNLLSAFLSKAGSDGRGPGIVTNVDLSTVLPDLSTAEHYMYTGSLTTPPCTEGIVWLVATDRIPISKEDASAIMRLQGGRNVRGVQPLNGRSVTRFSRIKGSPVTLAR